MTTSWRLPRRPGFAGTLDDRVGTQIETEALARTEHRGERLVFEIEQAVRVGRAGRAARIRN